MYVYMYCRPMCICTYVCTYVCIYKYSVPVCMYVRMHACMNVFMYAVCAYVYKTPPRELVCMYICIVGRCAYVRMYIRTYVYTSIVCVLLRFLFLRSTPFYIYVLNGIQLNLQASWEQEVRLTPITVEELEFIHRAPMRPYVPP